jgi:hypothetical protein
MIGRNKRKMNRAHIALSAIALASTLGGCATVPPKVLIEQSFHGEDKNLRTLMQSSGKRNEATKAQLFNVFTSVCDVSEGSAESACKDSKVLEDVIPGSLY